jgi:hypothetical protein
VEAVDLQAARRRAIAAPATGQEQLTELFFIGIYKD